MTDHTRLGTMVSQLEGLGANKLWHVSHVEVRPTVDEPSVWGDDSEKIDVWLGFSGFAIR